jgi:adenylate kinase family enzyme
MRIVVLGRGGAGKSAFSRQLAAATGAAWVEIDKIFWQSDLKPLPIQDWETVQEETFNGEDWIADGDLGPYDALDVRLRHADAVVLLDVPLRRCVWRSICRSRERIDYWRWLLTWRRKWRPALLQAIATHHDVELLIVRSAADKRKVLERLSSSE